MQLFCGGPDLPVNFFLCSKFLSQWGKLRDLRQLISYYQSCFFSFFEKMKNPTHQDRHLEHRTASFLSRTEKEALAFKKSILSWMKQTLRQWFNLLYFKSAFIHCASVQGCTTVCIIIPLPEMILVRQCHPLVGLSTQFLTFHPCKSKHLAAFLQSKMLPFPMNSFKRKKYVKFLKQYEKKRIIWIWGALLAHKTLLLYENLQFLKRRLILVWIQVIVHGYICNSFYLCEALC